MFAGAVFLNQYFELARGASPTMSGAMTIPVLAGLCVASTVSGRFITGTGRWKGWLPTDGVLLTAGLVLLGTLRQGTPYPRMAVFMVLTGFGVGFVMQNLVLCAQNQVGLSEVGSASSAVTFFRSLGGAVSVSVLGSVKVSSQVGHHAREDIGSLGPRGRLVAATASAAPSRTCACRPRPPVSGWSGPTDTASATSSCTARRSRVSRSWSRCSSRIPGSAPPTSRPGRRPTRSGYRRP